MEHSSDRSLNGWLSVINETFLNSSFIFEPHYFFDVPQVATQLTGTSRFGQSSDVSCVFGTKAERTDYMLGLAWLGILAISIFSIWLFLIILFYFLGQKRVGFLSGKPFKRICYYKITNNTGITDNNDIHSVDDINTTPFKDSYNGINVNQSDDGDVYLENESSFPSPLGLNSPSVKQSHSSNVGEDKPLGSFETSVIINNGQQQNKQITRIIGGRKICKIDHSIWVRTIFILCGISYVVFATLLVTRGIANLQGSIDTMGASSQAAANLAKDGSTAIDRALQILDDGSALRATLEAELNNDNFCPALPIDLSNNTIVETIRSRVNQTVMIMEQFDSEIESLRATSRSLDSTSRQLNSLYRMTNKIDVTDWECLALLIPYTMIPTFLIAAAIMSAFDVSFFKYRRFIVWFSFPIFVLMAITGAGLAAAFIMITTGNTDFCYPEQYSGNMNSYVPVWNDAPTNEQEVFVSFANSPDISVLNIAQKMGFPRDSLEYRVISFYITQCGTNNPLDFMLEYIPEVRNGLDSVERVMGQLNNTELMSTLSLLCNRNFDGLDGTLKDMANILVNFGRLLLDIIELVQCQTIVPIYQQGVYSCTCDFNMKATMWVFGASLACSFCAFLMITFRSAYSVTEDIYEYDTEYDRDDDEFHDENDPLTTNDTLDDHQINNDAVTVGGNISAYGDSVVNSFQNYEKSNEFRSSNPNVSSVKQKNSFRSSNPNSSSVRQKNSFRSSNPNVSSVRQNKDLDE